MNEVATTTTDTNGRQIKAMDPEALFRILRAYYLSGVLPDAEAGLSLLDGRVPALLAAAAADRTARGPWPAVLFADGSAESLTVWLDRILDEVCADNDEGALRRRLLYRVDRALREGVDNDSFVEAWYKAVETAGEGLAEDRAAALKDGAEAAQGRIPIDSALLACSRTSAERMLRSGLLYAHRAATADVRTEMEELARSMDDLLAVEDDESERDSDRLEQSTGGAFASAFDFGKLSELMENAPHAATLSDERRRRLEITRDGLRAHAARLFEPGTGPVKANEAVGAMDGLMDAVLGLARAATTARLELANRYDASSHDAVIGLRSRAFLSDAEARLAPPLLVRADEGAVELLLGLDRESGRCILVVSGAPDAVHPAAALAMNSGQYVAQCAVSDLDSLRAIAGDLADVRHHAVIVLYDPADLSMDTYLAAAAARDARAVPSFRCRPDTALWAQRLDVSANEQIDADFPSGSLAFSEPDGSERTVPITFTWADFATLLPAWQPHFVVADTDLESLGDRLVDVGTFLTVDSNAPPNRIPFVWVTDGEGALARAFTTRPVIRQTERIRRRWHALRELGSASNSYADAAREDERAAARAGMEKEIADLEAAQSAHMEQTTSALAERIVANIAAGLLGEATAAPSAASAVPAKAAAPVEAESVAESAAEPDEEDEAPALVLDEAYIETIRCTTCNECINQNGMMFAYNGEKQAFIKDLSAGTYRDMVMAAEKCPVRIIHPGKPMNADEPHLDDLLERAKPFA